MRHVEFTVLGPPQGKGRARSTRSGHHYTPEKTVAYESLIALSFQQAAPSWVPLDGPVYLEVLCHFAIPQSWSERKQKRALGCEVLPTTKPDADNVLKAVGDALNGIAWRDDSQVVTVTVRKRYERIPKVKVYIKEASEHAT